MRLDVKIKQVSEKDLAAVALGRKRWKGKTNEEKTEHSQNMNASRWADKTPEERAAHGQMLTEARAKARKKKATKKAGAKK